MHIIIVFNLIFNALYLCSLFYELHLLRVNTLKIDKTSDTFLTTELKKSIYCIFIIAMYFLFFYIYDILLYFNYTIYHLF